MAAFPGVLELHVRTISTNQAHPEAREPVLRVQVFYPITSVFLQIVDDVVGVMYCIDPSRPRITIWNWKTGHLVVVRPLRPPHRLHYSHEQGSGRRPPPRRDMGFLVYQQPRALCDDGQRRRCARALYVYRRRGREPVVRFPDVDADPRCDALPPLGPPLGALVERRHAHGSFPRHVSAR